MHDSGDRDTFDTGCVRDNGEAKPRPDLISPFAKIRLGEWLRKGAEKYDERNWEKGMPITRCLEAIDRHYCKYQMRMTDEDHMAAIMCNAMFIMHYEEMIKIGNLPATIDNRPSYAPKPLRVLTTPKYDGARIPVRSASQMLYVGDKPIKTGEAMCYDDKMANLSTKLLDAQAALMKELDDAYWYDQNSNTTGLNPILADHYPSDTYGQAHKPLSAMIPVSKITGKALVIPDDNKVDKPRTCCICGGKHSLKYYRQDLDTHYCSTCYHFNRIDLKPVITRS